MIACEVDVGVLIDGHGGMRRGRHGAALVERAATHGDAGRAFLAGRAGPDMDAAAWTSFSMPTKGTVRFETPAQGASIHEGSYPHLSVQSSL